VPQHDIEQAQKQSNKQHLLFKLWKQDGEDGTKNPQHS